MKRLSTAILIVLAFTFAGRAQTTSPKPGGSGTVSDATATVSGKSTLGQPAAVAYASLGTCAAGNDGQIKRVTDKNRDIYSCNGSGGAWVSRNGGAYNVKDFGAVGDGSTNDTTAVNAAIAAAKSNSPISMSGRVIFPPGYYLADISIIEHKGLELIGAGKMSTKLRAYTSGTSTINANGLWYSIIEGFTIIGNGSPTETVRLDGNYDGSHTQTVQGNTIRDCYIGGGGTPTYVFTISRSSSGQGSENIFINCHFEGYAGITALYYQNGYNALNNTFIGGNFQTYDLTAVLLSAGSAHFFSTAFQSTYAYAQITNNGWDIDASLAGTGDKITVIGSRTESPHFYHGGGSQFATITGLTQTVPGVDTAWAATTAHSIGDFVKGTTSAGNVKVYRCTTAGTTGGSEPTWPESSTVVDGTVTWTELDYTAISIGSGKVEDSIFSNGAQVAGYDGGTTFINNIFSRADFKAVNKGFFVNNYTLHGASNTIQPLNPRYANQVSSALSTSASVDITDVVRLQGNVIPYTPTQSATLNATTTPVAGEKLVLIVTTSGTSSYTITFGTNFKSTGTLATGTSSGAVFVVSFVSDGVNYNEMARSPVSGGVTANSTTGLVPYLSAANTYSDSPISRDDANTVSLQNGTNAQTFYIYYSTSGSSRAKFYYVDNTTFRISAPTPLAQLSLDAQTYVAFTTAGTRRGYFDSATLNMDVKVAPTSTNALDLGTTSLYFRTAYLQTLTLGSGTPASAIGAAATHGQNFAVLTGEESLTIAASATTDTAFTVPANAVVLAVSVRVTTVIPTAATFTVTGATSGTVFNTAAVAVAATTTDPGTKAGAYFNGTAQKIRITPDLTPGAATGVVRVTVVYYVVTPPTS